MSYINLIVKIEEKTALVTLNRPKALNALNKATIEELSSLLDELKEREDVRAVIVTGSGDKAFVAGADIKEFKDFDAAQGQALARKGHESLFDKIENFPKPVIAAINGYALGGGLELALACHVRIAAENALMGFPEVKLGLIPGYGGTQRLPEAIGKSRAIEMISSAEFIKASTALAWGLVNHVYPQSDLLAEAKSLAKKMNHNSASAIRKAIECVNLSGKPSGFEAEIGAFGYLFETEDFKEGTTAFVEKRKPKF